MFEKNKKIKKNQIAIINIEFPIPQDVFKVIPTNFIDEKKYIGKDYIIIKGKKYKTNRKKVKFNKLRIDYINWLLCK